MKRFLPLFTLLCLGLAFSFPVRAQVSDSYCPGELESTYLGYGEYFFESPYTNPLSTCVWYIDGQLYAQATTPTLRYTFPVAGQHQVTVTVTDPDCPSGFTQLVADFTFSMQDCVQNIVPLFDGCNRFSLNIANNASFTDLNWTINGVNYGAGTSIALPPPQVQTNYDVVLGYRIDGCSTNSLETSVTVDPCNLPCPDNIGLRPNNCNGRQFIISNVDSLRPVIWDFGDGSLVNGTANMIHNYLANGTYNVSVNVWSPSCPQGVTLTQTVDIVGCNINICPTNLVSLPQGCLTNQFILGEVPANGLINWNWGDNTSSVDFNFVNHTYNAPGTYNVCGTYSGPGCTQGATHCQPVTIAPCGNGACAQEIIVTGGQNNTYTFNIPNIPPDATVVWTADGLTFNATATFTRTFTALGIFPVTATFIDNDCVYPLQTLSVNLNVTGDFSGCPTSITLTQDPLICGRYSFNAVGASGSNAVYAWNAGADYSSTQPSPTFNFNTSGNGSVTLVYTSNSCWTKTLSVNFQIPNCVVPEICPNTINRTSIDNCATFQYSVGTAGAAGQFVYWDFGDGANYTGSSSEIHQFEAGGNYNVCAYYFDQQCPNGVNLCVNTTALNCNVSCTLNVIQTSETCGGNGSFAAVSGPSFATINWTVDGNAAGTGLSLSKDMLPGSHQICASYTIPECPATVSSCFTATIDPCTEIICPTEFYPVTGQVCGDYYLSVAQAAAFEQVEWTVDGNVVSNEGIALYHFDDPGIHTVCVDYSSAQCPAGANLCLDLDVPNCNDCPTQLQFQNVTCQSLVGVVGDPSIPSNIVWDFGDNTVYTSGNLEAHDYSAGGLYTVTAQYSSLYCAGTTLSRTIFIQSCTPECVAFPTVTATGCGELSMSASFYPFNATVEWRVEGSSQVYTGSNVVINNLNPGANAICTSIVSEFCPNGFEICLDYQLEECSPNDCPSYIIASTVPETCGLVRLQVPDAAINSTSEWMMPFAQDVNSPFIEYLSTTPGTQTFTVHYQGTDCPQGITLSTELDIPYCAFDCTLNTSYTETECGTYAFTATTATPNFVVNWTADGAPVSANAISSLRLYEGSHQVCAQVNSPGCATPQSLCTTILADTCIVVNCPTVLNYLGLADCGEFYMYIPEPHPTAAVEWTINGETILGGATLTYTFPTPGLYEVNAHYTAFDCPDGVDLQTFVVFQPCFVPCTVEASAVTTVCDVAELSAQGTPGNGTYTWVIDFADSYTGQSLSLPFERGLHNACVTYDAGNCESNPVSCVVFEVLPCSESCPTAFSVIPNPTVCGKYTFSVPNADADATISWTVNGFTYTGNNYEFTAPYTGNFQVTLNYESYNCYSGTTVVQTFTHAPCPQPCSLSIFNQFQECSNVVLNAVAPANVEVTWTVNGEVYATGYLLNATLDPGTYDICASFTDPECANGPDFNACTQIVIIPCLDCSLNVVATSLNPALPSNANYMFEVNGDPSPGTVTWDFGDNTSVVDDSLVTHTYAGTGDFAVCASVVDEACGTRSACAQISIDPCNNYSSLNITNLNVGGYAFYLFDANNQVLMSDEFTFVAPFEVNSYNLCLPDGCYRLRFAATNALVANNLPGIIQFSDADISGYFTQVNNTTYEYNFGVNSSCGNATNCNAAFDFVFTENPGEAVFTNHSTLGGPDVDISYTWTFGDNSSPSNSISPTHTFIENGDFQVCLEMTSILGCTDTECKTVSVFSNADNCQNFTVAFAWYADVTSAPYDSLYIRLYRNTGNELLGTYAVVSDEAPNTLSLCLPGDCYHYSVTAPSLNAGSQTVMAYVNGDEHAQVVLTPGTLQGEDFIGLIAGCPNSVAETAAFALQLYPNPTSDVFVIEGDWNGSAGMMLFDATGRKVMQQNLNARKTVIEASMLPAGLYRVQVQSAQGVATQALQIVR